MTALRPFRVTGQHKAHCRYILAAPDRSPWLLVTPRRHVPKYWQLVHFRGKRFHLRVNRRPRDLNTVQRQRDDALVFGCAGEQIFVDDFKAAAVHPDLYILVIELHFLHLRRRVSAAAVGNAVSAEIVVARSVVKIAAVAEHFVAISILVIDRLVYIIPDEPALEKRFLVRQIRVLVHRPAGVSHRVGVLAQQHRLLPVLRQKCLDGCRTRVHLALHVRGVIVAPVMEDPLVMDKSRVVKRVQFPGHRVDHRTAERLVSARPDEDRRVVLVALVHGIHPVKQQRLPLLPVSRNHALQHMLTARSPRAVCFHIALVDQIQPVLVAELIQPGIIRIMARAYGVDIVALHRNDVLQHLLLVGNPAKTPAKLMPVGALEHDALSVYGHNAVVDRKPPEPDFLRDQLRDFPVRAVHRDRQLIQERLLRTPEPRRVDRHVHRLVFPLREHSLNLRDRCCTVREHQSCPCRRHSRGFVHQPGQCNHQIRPGILPVQIRADPDIADVCVRHRIQIDAPKDPRKPEEILILAPASARPLVHLHRQLVLASLQHVCQLKLRRREAVLAVADITAVAPERKSALDALKGDKHPLSLKLRRHCEIFHIARRRIEAHGHPAWSYSLMPVPRILHVGILRSVVPLELYVRRNPYILPASAVGIAFVKIFWRIVHVLCIPELPYAVQRPSQALHLLHQLRLAPVISVVGVCRHPVLLIKQRIFYLVLHVHYSIHSFFYVFIIFSISRNFVFYFISLTKMLPEIYQPFKADIL